MQDSRTESIEGVLPGPGWVLQIWVLSWPQCPRPFFHLMEVLLTCNISTSISYTEKKKFNGLSVCSWWESLWGRLCKQDPLLLKIISPNKKWIRYYLSEWSLFTRLTAYLIKMPSSVPEWNGLETVSELLPSLLKAFWTLLNAFQYRILHPNIFFQGSSTLLSSIFEITQKLQHLPGETLQAGLKNKLCVSESWNKQNCFQCV